MSKSTQHNRAFDSAETGSASAASTVRSTGPADKSTSYPPSLYKCSGGRWPALRDVGRIVAFANQKEYCYACGDATKSYSARKLKHFTRQFVHLRPDTFVIFDRVVAGSESNPKTWLLHSIHEPVFPDRGPNFRIEHGGGRLDVWTLL
ncbi:MAG: hypothetical protein ACYTG0_34050, partial [Planctomycetota bacterium]